MLKIRCAETAVKENGEELNLKYRERICAIYEDHAGRSARTGTETIYFDATIYSDFTDIVILDADIEDNFVYKRVVTLLNTDLQNICTCATMIVRAKPSLA